MNATQAHSQIVSGISGSVERAAKTRTPVTKPPSLHQYVSAELRRSRRYNAIVFFLLAAAGVASLVLAFAWPYLGH